MGNASLNKYKIIAPKHIQFQNISQLIVHPEIILITLSLTVWR